MTMAISFIPSLEHLCCTKIILPLFEEVLPLMELYCFRTTRLLKRNTLALNMDPDVVYNMIYNIISEKIKILIPCNLLQKKLQNYIHPIFCAIEDWLKYCKNSWTCNDMLLTVLKSIPRCWSPDGSIDREKSAKILVQNSNLSPTCRFIFACNFCLLDDVLDIWENVTEFAKLYLQLHADGITALWIEWLRSTSKKDWRSFIKWALQMELYNGNVYILKYVFKTLNSVEKSQYLSSALTKKEVNSDIMCFGLPLMTRDEQELIFKKSPVQVVKGIISWPMRSFFFDIVDILMPNVTCDAFCDILNMLLLQIKMQKRDFDELVVILKKIWAESSLLFKNNAKNDSRISEPLQIALDYNFMEAFPTQEFLDSFEDNVWLLTPFVI